MSRSTGTGCPLWFQCAACRRKKAHRVFWRDTDPYRGGPDDVRLTGKTKRARSSPIGRIDETSRQYKCDCGHIGWPAHVDLKRKQRRNAK